MIDIICPVLVEEERFWSKVETRPLGCWSWMGGSVRSGYGQFHLSGTRKKVQAHRYAYELLVGPIPEGMTLDHLCRNRACVNPDHLEPVTNRENILRGEGPSAQHARATHCAQGHPYDEGNTYVRYDGRRVCRICLRKWDNEKRRRQRRRLPWRGSGEKHPNSKLTQLQVNEILSSATGRRGEGKAFAERYGVSVSTISLILKGERWKRDR